jgi:hypothetical protein
MSDERNNSFANSDDDSVADREQGNVHWLYRRETLPKLWLGGCALLALTLALEVFIGLHPHFGFADWIWFSAFYGFFTCVVMVVFAKWLGQFIKRSDDYYQRGDDQDPWQDGLDDGES